MIRNAFQDLSLPALGMGCMRLPTRNGEIDREATARMVDYAMAHGVNYFDTAWPYHEGKSEPVMGEILSRFPRESYYLATKFPGSNPKLFDDPAAVFETQLGRLRTDYVDFYLFHNVAEATIDRFLDPEKGLADYLIAQKRAGRIRHLGFSCHGSLPTMRRFLDALGPELEFCQIQLNWLDWSFQNAKEKVALLNRRGLPIWVMEPVRGGRLAALGETHTAALAALRPEESIPGWCFRFLQSLDGVTMVLSGMSDMRQLRENCASWSVFAPLNEAERSALLAIGEELGRGLELPCTACRYCVAGCPAALEIPALIKLYNEHCLTAAPSGDTLRDALAGQNGPADCLACRRCETVCPQQIRISAVMADFAAKLRG